MQTHPQNSNLLKIITCLFFIGLGVTIGSMFSSYIKTVPFFSLQSIQLSPPSPLPRPVVKDPLPKPSVNGLKPQPEVKESLPGPKGETSQPTWPDVKELPTEPKMKTSELRPDVKKPLTESKVEPSLPKQDVQGAQHNPNVEPPLQAKEEELSLPKQDVQDPLPNTNVELLPKPDIKNPLPSPKVDPLSQPDVRNSLSYPNVNPLPQPDVKVPQPNPNNEPLPQPDVKPPLPDPDVNPLPKPDVKTPLPDPDVNPLPKPDVKNPLPNPTVNPLPQPDVKIPQPNPNAEPALPRTEPNEPLLDPNSLMHHMNDSQLLAMAAATPRSALNVPNVTPKVAFMFMARGELPFAPVWEKFFKGHEGMFSIYLHLNPLYNENYPKESVFFERRIPSQSVAWGSVTLMEAERRLLANALLDHSNQRFVLLSEACVPIFNFSTVYSYLINSNDSYVSIYDDPGPTGRGRYNPSMQPLITIDQWRKSSQWFEIDRELAIEVVSDKIYFRLFKKFCKGNKGCYTDEHYLPTLINIKYAERNSNRSVTWVNWSLGGPHPARYYRKQVTPEFLKWLREGSTCTYNGHPTNTCFLFARKFLPNSLIRFEIFGPRVLGFG